MTAFIRPSLILRMDLDERLFNDECVSDIKRSYSYVAPSLVQAHKAGRRAAPENVMRFMIKLHRAYWDKSDEAAQQLWEGVMPKWLHNMFSKVSNTITAANNVRAENGQPAFPYHWLELEFGDNALIAVKTGSDSSFPADGVDMVERVRDLMNAGALGQDIACVRIPSRASYEAQLAAAEQAQAEAVVAAEQGDSAGQVAEQAELASVTAEQAVDVAGTAAEGRPIPPTRRARLRHSRAARVRRGLRHLGHRVRRRLRARVQCRRRCVLVSNGYTNQLQGGRRERGSNAKCQEFPRSARKASERRYHGSPEPLRRRAQSQRHVHEMRGGVHIGLHLL